MNYCALKSMVKQTNKFFWACYKNLSILAFSAWLAWDLFWIYAEYFFTEDDGEVIWKLAFMSVIISAFIIYIVIQAIEPISDWYKKESAKCPKPQRKK